MKYRRLLAIRFQDMLKRKEFFFSLSISLTLFLVPAFLDIMQMYKSDVSNLRPAWYYFGLSVAPLVSHFSTNIVQLAFLLFVPLLSCIAYSYCYFDESKNRAAVLVVARAGRRRYYVSSAAVVLAAGFLVIFIPMAFSQIAFLIALPSNPPAPVTSPAYTDTALKNVTYFTFLANNAHYAYNFLYCFISAAICGLIGLLGYSISLFNRKNRFVVATIPFILYLISEFIFSLIGKAEWQLAFIIAPPIKIPGIKLSYLLVTAIGLLLINFSALFYKIHFTGDEL